jgi:hypothetical protein
VVYATSNGEDPWDSKSQRSEIKPETTLDVDGGNKRFRLITGDKEGNWSKETEINFIDQEKKHEIRLETGFGKGETIVQFVFPVDEQSFKTSIQSLVNESLEYRVVDKKAVKKALTELPSPLINTSFGFFLSQVLTFSIRSSGSSFSILV